MYLFQEEAEDNARLLFDFILDYHQKQKAPADSNMSNHPPVIWLLTELLKTSMVFSLIFFCHLKDVPKFGSPCEGSLALPSLS
jgi:hypothetical protein